MNFCASWYSSTLCYYFFMTWRYFRIHSCKTFNFWSLEIESLFFICDVFFSLFFKIIINTKEDREIQKKHTKWDVVCCNPDNWFLYIINSFIIHTVVNIWVRCGSALATAPSSFPTAHPMPGIDILFSAGYIFCKIFLGRIAARERGGGWKVIMRGKNIEKTGKRRKYYHKLSKLSQIDSVGASALLICKTILFYRKDGRVVPIVTFQGNCIHKYVYFFYKLNDS